MTVNPIWHSGHQRVKLITLGFLIHFKLFYRVVSYHIVVAVKEFIREDMTNV